MTAPPTTYTVPGPTYAAYGGSGKYQYQNRASGELSYTGAGPLPALLALGLGLLAVGTTMLVGARRRRSRLH